MDAARMAESLVTLASSAVDGIVQQAVQQTVQRVVDCVADDVSGEVVEAVASTEVVPGMQRLAVEAVRGSGPTIGQLIVVNVRISPLPFKIWALSSEFQSLAILSPLRCFITCTFGGTVEILLSPTGACAIGATGTLVGYVLGRFASAPVVINNYGTVDHVTGHHVQIGTGLHGDGHPVDHPVRTTQKEMR